MILEEAGFVMKVIGVGDRDRTGDTQSHSLVL